MRYLSFLANDKANQLLHLAEESFALLRDPEDLLKNGPRLLAINVEQENLVREAQNLNLVSLNPNSRV